MTNSLNRILSAIQVLRKSQEELRSEAIGQGDDEAAGAYGQALMVLGTLEDLVNFELDDAQPAD